MIKWMPVIFYLLLTNSVMGEQDRWSTHYQLVNKDIENIRSIKKKDKTLVIRLFELYGEKFALLAQKENEYRLNFLNGTKKLGELKRIQKLQQTTLKNIDFLASTIKQGLSDRRILAKISYYRALSYQLKKDEKTFFKEMNRASQLNTDPKLTQLINTKLADYHYNNKNYSQAIKYYSRIINDPKDRWLTKHFYNLGWSLFKTGKNTQALVMLKKTVELSRSKRYFNLGDQLYDSIILFYANAHEIEEGLAYLRSKKLDTFDRLLKYLHYTFEYSKKEKAPTIINKMYGKALSVDNRFELMDKEILVYRTLKYRRKLQKQLSTFEKFLIKNRKNPDIDKKNELVNSLISYTGYLQELIKSKNLLSQKNKAIYVRYIVFNFGLLRRLDEENSLKYRFFQGETYFNLAQYRKASRFYLRAISEYDKSKSRENRKYLARVFDSLFKSLENANVVSGKELVYTYRAYLKYFPRTNLSPIIHEKLLAYYLKSKESHRAINSLVRYNKLYPQRKSSQIKSYNILVAQMFGEKDFHGVEKIRALLKKGFLGLGNKEISKIDKDFATLTFAKYEQLEKDGKVSEAIIGFSTLAENPKQSYLIRSSALRKSMLLNDKIFSTEKLSANLVHAAKLLRSSDLRKYDDELTFYLQNVCFRSFVKECVQSFNALNSRKVIKFPKAFYELDFKNRILLGNKTEKSFARASDISERRFLFEQLLASSPNFDNSLYKKFYQIADFQKVISDSVELKFWQIYFDTLSLKKVFSFVDKLQLPDLRSKLLARIKQFNSQNEGLALALPKQPNWEKITFEAFSAYNEKLVSELFGKINLIDKEITKVDTNFVPKYLTEVINELEKINEQVKSHKPIASDQELVKAINNELLNITTVIEKKIEQYNNLYSESLAATLQMSGARRYRNTLMGQPVPSFVEGGELWVE